MMMMRMRKQTFKASSKFFLVKMNNNTKFFYWISLSQMAQITVKKLFKNRLKKATKVNIKKLLFLAF